MSRYAAPKGSRPALQWFQVSDLLIDADYQRSVDNRPSASLIRKIAEEWDWTLCQPLVVAIRDFDKFYVIDGQHRLAAAIERQDIDQLPCIAIRMNGPAEEAASFVAFNTRRRPLTALQLFHAAVAAGSTAESVVLRICNENGLRIGKSSNILAAPPGTLINVSGLLTAHRLHGDRGLDASLDVIAQAWKGEVLQYVGTLYAGIAEMAAAEVYKDKSFTDGERFERMVSMLAKTTQEVWVRRMYRWCGDQGVSRSVGLIEMFADAWKAVGR